ncbi:MAG TPA: RHS repeat-associated core domain-containing protein, partial [Pirellulales bacterium]|nr:RHS repeat-associated core domain-containing protein [Pirellulales bacterium]
GRWYNPGIQRWMSQDPSGLGPDSNPYRPVGNSPTKFIDPSGLADDWPPLGYGTGTISVGIYPEDDAWTPEGRKQHAKAHPKEPPIATLEQLKTTAETFTYSIPVHRDAKYPPLQQAIDQIRKIKADKHVNITTAIICDHSAHANGVILQRLIDPIDPKDPLWQILANEVLYITLGGCNIGEHQRVIHAYADGAQREVGAAETEVMYGDKMWAPSDSTESYPWIYANPGTPLDRRFPR